MSRSKYSTEWKIEIVKKYLSGEGSYERISQAYGIGAKTLKDWVHKYREQGAAGFWKGTGNRHYSKEFSVELRTDELMVNSCERVWNARA